MTLQDLNGLLSKVDGLIDLVLALQRNPCKEEAEELLERLVCWYGDIFES